jgi:hypothetical protein
MFLKNEHTSLDAQETLRIEKTFRWAWRWIWWWGYFGCWQVIAPLVCNNTNPAALSPACTNSGKLITENENATFTDLSQGKPPRALVPQSHVHSRLFLRLQNQITSISILSKTSKQSDERESCECIYVCAHECLCITRIVAFVVVWSYFKYHRETLAPK